MFYCLPGYWTISQNKDLCSVCHSCQCNILGLLHGWVYVPLVCEPYLKTDKSCTYDLPIFYSVTPAQFLVPLDCSKVPAPWCIFKRSMGTGNWVGIGLLYLPPRARFFKPFKEPGIDSQPGGPVWQPYLLYRLTRLNRLAESIRGNQFLGSLNVYK
jgi:hypothetical protein